MTSSGVQVGDTTLLVKLRQTAADHEDGMGLLTGQFTQLVDALPAVVTALEALQRIAEMDKPIPTDRANTVGYFNAGSCAEVARAALAPFVGEATQ